jgi:hypothetical protein
VRYARATWRIFLAWAARRLHLRNRVVERLEDEAILAMFTCSLEFEPAEVVTSPRVVGWRCTHMSLTGGPAVSVEPVHEDWVTSV